MARLCAAGDVEIGSGRPLGVIAGPCVLESRELGLTIARTLAPVCKRLGLGFVFKASYDKANRSSVASSRGPGLQAGLEQLADISQAVGCPVTTDIHEPQHAQPAAQSVDLIQIPAFLCRQTDLLMAAGIAAAARGRAVNVKKGQFVSPVEMRGPVRKLAEAGCDNVLLTERGTFFGYHRLVNDFVGLGDLLSLDCSGFPTRGAAKSRLWPFRGRRGAGDADAPAGKNSPPVCFDVTHSTQLPGAGEQSGGRPEHAPLLARAAVAAGVHAVFIECHPEPSKAMSDAATQLPLDAVPALLERLAAVRAAAGIE